MLEKLKFYIDGQWVLPQVKNDFEVINPANEEVCATISLGDQADTDAAVAAANKAFPSWSATPHEERIRLVEKLSDIYEARRAEMGEMISIEMGAPIDLAMGAQAGCGTGHIAGFLVELKKIKFERMLGDHAPNDRIFMEAIGVCGLITPWNWPMNQVTLKVIPAIAVGCTVVLKPSEIAPLSSLLFAEMMDEAGFPKGVFNLVNGDGIGVGSQLSSHKDIEMISFTGSSRAGVLISQAAAPTIKRVSLELGGKGANVIFDDADDQAVQRGVAHCFNNSGQSCNAPTRMLVQRGRYDEAVKQATEYAKNTPVKLSSENGTHLGPVVSQVQYDKIQGMIEAGINEGAKLVAGGLGRPQGLNRGYYIRPTIFADVSNDMRIAQEEIFGPVLSIIPFDDEADAIQIANDSPYGLTHYVQTQDKEKAHRMAKALRAGMVEINGHSRGAGAPFGGYKQSGNGREAGIWGIDDFLEVKSVSGW
ncbi:MAG: aldehyde dehydrogenase family protein [Hyphomicrobiales bacterium]|nr:MAG: aldehyde dehydrogenase family protein [Hyphomicrobiales bacterium]